MSVAVQYAIAYLLVGYVVMLVMAYWGEESPGPAVILLWPAIGCFAAAYVVFDYVPGRMVALRRRGR